MEDQVRLQTNQTLQEVNELIQKYGTQARELQSCRQKLTEGIQSISQVQKWCEQASSDLQDMAYDCTRLLECINGTLDTDHFSEFCRQIGTLAETLKECIAVKDALVSVRPDIQAYADERFEQLNALLASCEKEMHEFATAKDALLRMYDARFERIEIALQESCKREERILALLEAGSLPPTSFAVTDTDTPDHQNSD